MKMKIYIIIIIINTINIYYCYIKIIKVAHNNINSYCYKGGSSSSLS